MHLRFSSATLLPVVTCSLLHTVIALLARNKTVSVLRSASKGSGKTRQPPQPPLQPPDVLKKTITVKVWLEHYHRTRLKSCLRFQALRMVIPHSDGVIVVQDDATMFVETPKIS